MLAALSLGGLARAEERQPQPQLQRIESRVTQRLHPQQPKALPSPVEVVLRVGSGQRYSSVPAALADAPDGAVLLLEPGTYSEPLIISRSVRLEAAGELGSAVLAVDAALPYVRCVEVAPAGDAADGAAAAPVHVELVGLALRHRSKSVAANYALLVLAGCSLTLRHCDVSSRSGDGAAVEGGALALLDCTVHDCERHGVAVYGNLDGAAGFASLERCTVSRNLLDGVISRDGGCLQARKCALLDNGGYGLAVLDGGAAHLSGCRLAGNAAGAAALSEAENGSSNAEQLAADNELDRAVALL